MGIVVYLEAAKIEQYGQFKKNILCWFENPPIPIAMSVELLLSSSLSPSVVVDCGKVSVTVADCAAAVAVAMEVSAVEAVITTEADFEVNVTVVCTMHCSATATDEM